MSGRAKNLFWAGPALAVAVLACSRTVAGSRPSPAPGAKDQKADPTVVATVGDQPITQGEVDARAAGRLQQIRDQEYEARRQALDEIVTDRILDREAARRGISRDELVRAEVDQKIAKPTAQDIDQVYQLNKGRMGGRSRDEMAPEIERSIVRQRSAEQAQVFMAELRRSAVVHISLTQPRVEVALPADAAVLGPEKAPVTIVEFSDYLCPYCQHAEQTVDQVLSAYKGKVRFAHRDFLLGRPRSMAAARSAHCAREDGKFWEYRRELLNRPGDWSDEDLVGRAKGLGLDGDRFKACLASDRHDKEILDASEQGRTLGVSATPTFFVNGRRMQGAKSLAEFQDVVDSELKAGG
jgi:protein-disulfide isomerase